MAKKRSGYGSALEQSKVEHSDSNGTIESTIGDVGGLARTLRASVEIKIGVNI